MATWPTLFTDPAERYIAEGLDAKDAAYWHQTVRSRTKPPATDAPSIRALVEYLAPEYGIEPAFATAIAKTESNFQPGVVSSAGAKGIMQLMDGTAKRFGVRDSFDPEQNIRGGLAYLAVLQEMFPGRRDLQMAAYNAGEGAVKKYGNAIPPYAETQEYVRRVSGQLAKGPMLMAQQQAQHAAMLGVGGQRPPAEEDSSTPFTPPARPRGEAAMMPDIQGMPPVTMPAEGDEIWMPAPKPIERALVMGGTFLGSIGAGFARGAAHLMEAPSTALRTMGIGGQEPSVLEQGADWVRKTFVEPMEQLEARQPRLLMQIGEGIGQAGTFIVPGIGIEGAVARIATNAPKVAAMFGATTSGVLQGAVAMNDTYQSLKPLVGEEEAGKRAQTSFAVNTLLGTVGSALGVFNRWVPEGLSRVVVGAVSQGGQEGIEYDWNRRFFWVNGDAPNAEALERIGWERRGDKVVQPYSFKDQLEAALVGTVVGGLFGAATEYSKLPMPAGLDDVRNDPGFTVERGLEAAMNPETPPADIELPRWQRWAQAILDLLPEPGGGGGLLTQTLRGQRGSISPRRVDLRKQRRTVDEQLMALERGGEEAQQVMETLGVQDADVAQDQLMTQRQGIVDELAALPPDPIESPTEVATETAAPPLDVPEGSVTATIEEQPGIPGLLPPQDQPGAAQPPLSLAAQTEVEPPQGRLDETPTHELELLRAIRQTDPITGKRGIKLTGEAEATEWLELIRPTRAGQGDMPALEQGIRVGGLLNNVNGATPQEMATRLWQAGFLKTDDKDALRAALHRRIIGGEQVYSQHATGHIPLFDTAEVTRAHQALKEFMETHASRLETQVRGTRPISLEISEAETMMQAGLWTQEDIMALYPGTMPDPQIAIASTLTNRRIADEMIGAARRVVETGGRDQAAILDYFTIKTMFADMHVMVRGLRAEAGRLLRVWNDPMAPHNQYMDALQELVLTHGQDTAYKMARADLSLATPEEQAEAIRLREEANQRFNEMVQQSPMLGPEQAPMRDDWGQQQTLFSADEIQDTWAMVMGDEIPMDVSPESNVPPLPNIYGPGLPGEFTKPLLTPRERRQYQQQQQQAMDTFIRKLRDEAGLPQDEEMFRRRHEAEPLSHWNDPAEMFKPVDETLPLFTPSELDTRLKQALGWDLLTAAEKAAAQQALQRLMERHNPDVFSAYQERVNPPAGAIPGEAGAATGQLPLFTTTEVEDGEHLGQLTLQALYGDERLRLPRLRTAAEKRQMAAEWQQTINDFLLDIRQRAGLPSEAEMFRRTHEAEVLSHYNEPSQLFQDETLPLFTPSELNPLLKQALGWDMLTAEEKRAVTEELSRFARYRRAPGMGKTEDEGTPLMLDAESQKAPSDVELGREAGLSQTQLRTIQANLGQAQPGLWKMYLEQWKAAMLGPVTMVTNAVSNTGLGIYSLPVRFFAGTVSPLRRGVENMVLGMRGLEGSAETGVGVGEVGDLLYGASHGWMDHLRAMTHVWQGGESRIDPGHTKTDVRHPKAVTAENLGLEGTTLGKVLEFWGEHLGFMSGGRDVYRVLNTTDELYLGLAYVMERQALAHAEARAQGLTGLSRAQMMARVMSDPNVAERIHHQAVEAAKYQTLRSDLPTTGVGAILPRIANWTIDVGDVSIPAGNLLVPFYTVPTNAARYAVENSPLALLFSKRFYQNMAAGGRQADMALGRLITGSLTAASVASLVGAFALTGRAPSDPALREAWLKEHPEYSAYVPGVGWVDYKRWLGPLGNSMAIVADTAQLMGEIQGDTAMRLAAAGMLALQKNLVGATGWKDIGDFLEIVNGNQSRVPESSSDVLKNLMRYLRREGLPMLTIPLTLGYSGSAMARAFVEMVDPEMKHVMSWIDQIYAQTPGWSQIVPRRRTITGEPELYGIGIGPDMLKPLTRAFLPGIRTAQPLSPADAAILDNDMRLSKVEDRLDPIGIEQASSDVQSLRGMEGTKLSADEHERYQVLAALNEEQAKILYGTNRRVIPQETMALVTESAAALAQAAADPTLQGGLVQPPKAAMALGEMLDWLTTTPAFQRAAPGQGGGKELAFQRAIQEYQKWGKELFLELEPGIGNRHAQSKIQQQIQRYPVEEREVLRLTLEEGHRATRPAMRQVMGLPALPVGGP